MSLHLMGGRVGTWWGGGQCCRESDLGQQSGEGTLHPFPNSRLGDKYLVSSSHAGKCPRLCEQDLQKAWPRDAGLLVMATAFCRGGMAMSHHTVPAPQSRPPPFPGHPMGQTLCQDHLYLLSYALSILDPRIRGHRPGGEVRFEASPARLQSPFPACACHWLLCGPLWASAFCLVQCGFGAEPPLGHCPV